MLALDLFASPFKPKLFSEATVGAALLLKSAFEFFLAA